jgi:hypothetical protein
MLVLEPVDYVNLPTTTSKHRLVVSRDRILVSNARSHIAVYLTRSFSAAPLVRVIIDRLSLLFTLPYSSASGDCWELDVIWGFARPAM